MSEECLICSALLEYLEKDELMECAVCHKKEHSKTRCIHGHYVCNECHTAGMDTMIGLCLAETSRNPVEIIEKMMELPFCHMHGPEHHVMVGAALLVAYKNAGGNINLETSLAEMMNRGKSVPGGACGFWGACGAGISAGMFVSIISESTPLTEEPFGLSHRMTAKSLYKIGQIGGPRCCKRDSYLSILSAIDFTAENFNVRMEKSEIICKHSAQNNQCIGKRCPFAKANRWIFVYQLITVNNTVSERIENNYWCTGILSEAEFNFISGHLSDGSDKVLDTVNMGIVLPGMVQVQGDP